MHRIGLLGLDGHQGFVLHGIPKRKDACLQAVASDNPDQLAALKTNPAVTDRTRFYSDWQEMLDREDLTLACICSINSLHAPMLNAAASRKLHIISEKPLTLTLQDLVGVRKAIEDAGVRLTMLMTMRWTPCYRAVQQVVREGRIGKPILATAFKSYRLGNRPEWQKRKQTFGGTIPFVNIHSIDLLRWTTGVEFTECKAYHGNAGKPEAGEMEDHAVVIFRMANGGVAVSQQDYLRPAAAATHGQAFLRIVGSDGHVEVGNNEESVSLTTSRNPETRLALAPEEDYLAEFLDSLEGKREHLFAMEDAFRLTEISLKAHEAAETGRTVRL